MLRAWARRACWAMNEKFKYENCFDARLQTMGTLASLLYCWRIYYVVLQSWLDDLQFIGMDQN